MAELLIYNRTDPDAPRRDSVGGYRLGDIVVIMPNGHQWGREEVRTDKFYVLRVPDLTIAEAEEFVEEHESGLVDADGDPIVIRRREWWMDESLLSANDRARLHNNTLTIPNARLQALMKRKSV